MNPFQNTLPTQFKIPFQNTLPTQQMNPFYWTLPTQQMLSFQRTQLTQQKINDRIQNTQKRLKALQSTSIYQTPNMQQGISMYQNVPKQISNPIQQNMPNDDIESLKNSGLLNFFKKFIYRIKQSVLCLLNQSPVQLYA